MYTVQKARPLDPTTLIILHTLHDIAKTHRASYFVIGATARDILMTHVFGIDAGRATHAMSISR